MPEKGLIANDMGQRTNVVKEKAVEGGFDSGSGGKIKVRGVFAR